MQKNAFYQFCTLHKVCQKISKIVHNVGKSLLKLCATLLSRSLIMGDMFIKNLSTYMKITIIEVDTCSIDIFRWNCLGDQGPIALYVSNIFLILAP